MSRILIYSDRGGIYGAEQINHRLAMAFSTAGYATSMALPKRNNAFVKERAELGIRHFWLADENVYDWHHPALSLTSPAESERCLRAVRPDLVLFADSFPFANLAAKRAAAAAGIQYLVLIHCVQSGWAEQYGEFLNQLPELYRSAIEVVAVSRQNLELMWRVFGLQQERGRVILNGRPDEYFAPRSDEVRLRIRASLDIAPQHIVSLSVGRMELVKGWFHQLEALRFLHRCAYWEQLRFVWVGAGSFESRARRFAALLAPGRVQLLSVRHDVPDLLDAADLLVHPAEFEGMPLVVLESMAKGLPVIATAVSGIPEALGETGLLLPPPRDVPRFGEHLAAAICKLAGDPERRRKLGRDTRARALAHFTEGRMITDWLELVQSSAAAGK